MSVMQESDRIQLSCSHFLHNTHYSYELLIVVGVVVRNRSLGRDKQL